MASTGSGPGHTRPRAHLFTILDVGAPVGSNLPQSRILGQEMTTRLRAWGHFGRVAGFTKQAGPQSQGYRFYQLTGGLVTPEDPPWREGEARNAPGWRDLGLSGFTHNHANCGGGGESERIRLRSACASQAPRRTQGTLYFPFRKKGWPASGYKIPGLWEGPEWNKKQGRERDRQM